VMCGLLNTKNTREQTTIATEGQQRGNRGTTEGHQEERRAKSKSKLYLDDDDMQKGQAGSKEH